MMLPPLRARLWAGARPRLLALCVIGSLLLFGSGCGKRADRNLTNLRLYLWADVARESAVTRAVREFESAHPGTRVSVEFVPAVAMGGVSAYEQKLLILIAARDSPDVFLLPLERFRMYAEKGALLPVEPSSPPPSGTSGQERPALERREATQPDASSFEVNATKYGLPFWDGNPLCVSAFSKYPALARELALAMSRSTAAR